MNEVVRWQLINATLNGDSQRLRHLLSRRVGIGIVQMCQLFHLAAACGSIDSLRILLDCMPANNVNSRDEVGCTALHKAASAGHREVIHFLIYNGAQVNVQEYLHGNSPLHEAASKGFSRSVEALCIVGASPNLQNKLGLTPLHLSAQNGHKQSVRYLLFFGADVGAADKFGNTCLHTATRYGRGGAVKILLSAYASVAAVNHNLDTPLHIAASLKRTKLARYLLAFSASRASASLVSTPVHTGGGSLRKASPSPVSLTPAQAVLWMRNAQGEIPLEVAKRRTRSGSGGAHSDMISFLLDQMNAVERRLRCENGSSKPFVHSFLNERPPLSTTISVSPYMSSDVIYSSLRKTAEFKFPFKNRNLSTTQPTMEPAGMTSPDEQGHQKIAPMKPPQVVPGGTALQSASSEQNTQLAAPCADGAVAGQSSYFSGALKTKSRFFGLTLLRGLFKKQHKKTDVSVRTGAMKRSESSQLQGSEVSKLLAKTENLGPKMPASVSMSGAFNDSHSSSLTGRSVVGDTSVSVDEALQHSFLCRPQPLSLPQNNGNTSVDLGSLRLPEGITTSSCDERGVGPPQPSAAILRSRPAVLVPLAGDEGPGGAVRDAGGVGGGNERARPRLGVRFDLDAKENANATPSPPVHGRQLSVQLYRDLAGNLKKGLAGSPSGCNCVQRQTDYFAGKVADFVPCTSHSYLDFRASMTDLRNPNVRGNKKPRGGRGVTKLATVAAADAEQWMRSRSDESLSVGAQINTIPSAGETPSRAASRLTTTGAMAEKSQSSALPADACVQTSNGRSASAIYEDVSGWPVNGHEEKPMLSSQAEPPTLTLHQKMSKSKSYSGQMAAAVTAKMTTTQGTNVGVLNTGMTRRLTEESPLYMSCRNIDGKMGLSLGPLISAIPTVMPTNGTR